MTRSVLLPVAIAFLAGAAPASARQMHDYDLASLWYMSEVVVEGEELGYTEWNSSWFLGKLRVTRVHKGPDTIGVGDEIPVATHGCTRKLSSLWRHPDTVSQQGPDADTKQVLLFLKWNEEGNVYRPAEHYLQVASGIKLIVDAENVVYRFEQMINPGLYELVRQGPELIERSELARREVPAEIDAVRETFPGYWESEAYVYGRSALRRDLELASQHVERFETALSAGDLDALESFLPSTLPMAIRSTQDDRPFLRGTYANALASDAAGQFAQRADDARIAAVLESHRHQLTYDVLQILERALAD
jgi:hypothetical protein